MAIRPMLYLEGNSEHTGRVLEGGNVIEMRHLYESEGHELLCSHDWEFIGVERPPGQ